MINKIAGKAHVLGHDISICDILGIPVTNDDCPDSDDIKPFARLDGGLAGHIKADDIIIAGNNFGVCLDSFWEAHIISAIAALKKLHLSALVANSFARPFYRAAINNGLMLIESKEAFGLIKSREDVEIDFISGEIKHKSGNVSATPVPEVILRIIEAGGLVGYGKKAVGGR